MGSAKKELKELVRAAEAQGWRVKKTKKGHLMFLAPDGMAKVVAPGGGRAMENLVGKLRSYGFVWKGR
jgi:predicted RNA binding protein YcfA (HicA-like mRNA interferase family)